jgi:hypothetical protein
MPRFSIMFYLHNSFLYLTRADPGDFLSEHPANVDIFIIAASIVPFKSIVLFTPVFYSAGYLRQRRRVSGDCPEFRFISLLLIVAGRRGVGSLRLRLEKRSCGSFIFSGRYFFDETDPCRPGLIRRFFNRGGYEVEKYEIPRVSRIGWGLLLLCLLLFLSPTLGHGRDYKFTDAHLHYVNYVLQSQGFQSLFSEMDKNKIERVVVFGLGYGISWPDIRAYRVKYYTDPETGTDYTPPVYFTKMGDFRLLMDYSKLSPTRKAKIYPFLQAINVTDRNEIYYVREMFNNHPELCGIGELMIRQEALNQVTSLTPTGDSVALAPILDFAAANHMPVLLHQNLSDETSKSPEDLRDPVYLKEITDLLARHPETTVIWAHAGISRNLYIRDHLMLLQRLLVAHPNLYFDLSWIVWENGIERDLKAWADLIVRYPDRFMLGSDKIGSFKVRSPERLSASWSKLLSSQANDAALGDAMNRYIPLLQEIDKRRDGETVSDMLAYRNINWLLGRITRGCKSGKPIVDPWKGDDPWKDPRYARPVMTVKLNNDRSIPVSVHTNYKNLADDIRGKYYSRDKKHEYAGVAESISIPDREKKLGVGLFAASGFKNYTGFLAASRTEAMPVQSVLLIENWEEAFGYKNNGMMFFPNGNWPTVPWWKDESGQYGYIDKVRVPDGRQIILYADEYFRGEVLRTIPSTKGKFESLGDMADKVKSFQFVPDDKKE